MTCDPIDVSTLAWRKSTFSNGGEGCVELAVADVSPAEPNVRLHVVRDSKNPDGPVLVFPASEWRSFIGGVKAGRFHL